MQFIAVDILAEARGLSIPFSAAGIALGALLWVFGWRWHRFWIVLATTAGAGLIGLSSHQAIGPRMLACGLLLAIAAGMMAIDLSRLLAFCACGLGCWLIVQRVLPNFHEPLICFLLGGILGILLYRLHLMIITSFAGTILFGYSLILLTEKLAEMRFSSEDWARGNALGLNIAVVIVTVFGLAAQGQLERWRDQANGRRRSWLMSYLSEDEREYLRNVPRRGWFGAIFGRS